MHFKANVLQQLALKNDFVHVVIAGTVHNQMVFLSALFDAQEVAC